MGTRLSWAVTLGALSAALACSPTIVPASEMPEPPEGDGWWCSSYRTAAAGMSAGGGDSVCRRSAERCEAAVESRAQLGNATGFTACQHVEEASCTHVFGMGDGELYCYTSMAHCKASQGGVGYVPVKQTECTVLD